jgi:hypothetical protein
MRGINIQPLGRSALCLRTAFVVIVLLATARGANPADADKQLTRVTGTVGFAAAPAAPLHQVFGHETIANDQYAVTRKASAAEIILPDSSIVSLGQNTLVQVGAFDSSVAGPGATIEIQGGSLRFDVRRPQGGVANYLFRTNTSQIAVRGTVGLISLLNGTTTVACLVCQADSVTIVAAGRTIALTNGQFVTIDGNGVVTVSDLTSALLQMFQAEYVSTAAEGGIAADTIEVGGDRKAAVVPFVAAGVAAAAGIAILDGSGSINGNPTAAPTLAPTAAPTGVPTTTPTSTPTTTPTIGPTATPTANANVGIEAKRRSTATPGNALDGAAPPNVPSAATPQVPRGQTR